MATIVEKVKEKVRGRSRSRRSIARGEERASGEFHDSTHDTTRDSQNLDEPTTPRMSSPTIPAWHIRKGNRNSADLSGVPQVPPIDPQYYNDSSTLQHNGSQRASYGHQYKTSTGSENIPARFSSLHGQSQPVEQRPLEGQQEAAVQYPHTVPRRKESLSQNKVGRSSLDKRMSRNRDSLDASRQYPQTSEHANSPMTGRNNNNNNGETVARLPDQPATSNFGNEVNQAFASMDLNDRTGHHTNGSHLNNTLASESLEHLRIPQGFNLGHSVRTSVDTEWRPAVTHEHKYHERTEIVREAITRDIHIHHYYTYLQPIRVVEVLPVKHYRIDDKTGLKVEIAAPAGWTMPENLQPRQEDHGFVRGWERHYLVDEQHPNGIQEPPPSHHEHANHVSTK